MEKERERKIIFHLMIFMIFLIVITGFLLIRMGSNSMVSFGILLLFIADTLGRSNVN